MFDVDLMALFVVESGVPRLDRQRVQVGVHAKRGESMALRASSARRWVSAHANVRVASAARRSYAEALIVCFRGGAFSAVLDITLCIGGVTLIYVILYAWYVGNGKLEAIDVPVLMVGYGFGASFVALFMQVRGVGPLFPPCPRGWGPVGCGRGGAEKSPRVCRTPLHTSRWLFITTTI